MRSPWLILSFTVGSCIALSAGLVFADKRAPWRHFDVVVDGWYLQAQGDQVALASKRSDADWYASAPWVRCGDNLYLAGDQEGKNPTVQLVRKEGKHREWAFEVIENIQNPMARGTEAKKYTYKGFVFRMMLTEGPYKNWYLAVEQPPQLPADAVSIGTVTRTLKLVKNPKDAAVLEYHDTEFDPKGG